MKRDVECNHKKCLTDGWLSGGRVKCVRFRDESICTNNGVAWEVDFSFIYIRL